MKTLGRMLAATFRPTGPKSAGQLHRAARHKARKLSTEAGASLAKLKKGEAVAKAEGLLEGTRWLPAPLRIR